MNQEGIGLFDLNSKIKHHLQIAFPSGLWVVAEVSELRVNQSGHCYLELIEKDIDANQIIAKARATIWAYSYRMLKAYFETTTGQPFVAGIKILVKATVEFQEVYGLSLNITDIDPSYTLGDIALRRKEILERLEKEGVINMNREVEFPGIPKTIAIISSPTAAGYEDFTNQLDSNPYGFKFHYKLFAAVMQGTQAEVSVIKALDRIYQHENIFDVVVMVRGGGSQADLNCFDSYRLASHIAQFPLPVVSGIGHERDDTITDMVAHTRVKTPTAAAEFLIDCFSESSAYVQNLQDGFLAATNRILINAHNRIQNSSQKFSPLVKQALEKQHSYLRLLTQSVLNQNQNYILKQSSRLRNLGRSLKHSLLLWHRDKHAFLSRLQIKQQMISENFLRNQAHRLQLLSQSLRYSNPENILKKGYSLTLKNKKIIRNVSQIQEADRIETRLANGKIISDVVKTQKKNQRKARTR